MMNRWLGRSQKITFYRQLRKIFTTGAEEKNIGDININFKKPEVYPVLDPDKTPYEYFKYFVTDEMPDAIAEQTIIVSNLHVVVLSIPQEKKSKYSLVFIFE